MIYITLVTEMSKFSSSGRSSTIISKLDLLNSVQDTFREVKLWSLDNATTIVTWNNKKRKE